MKKTEAIKVLERYKRCTEINEVKEAIDLAITALRPVSREQVWRGEWMPVGDDAFYSRCSKCGKMAVGKRLFCPNCGAPMTDEAVQMVMERLGVLHNA